MNESQRNAWERHADRLLVEVPHAELSTSVADDAHVAEQKDRYRRRRDALRTALEASGHTVDHSEAGLYLWTRRADLDPADATAQDSWDLLGDLADLGIIAGPGVFYGAGGDGYVRVAITATDEAVASKLREELLDLK